MKNATGIAIIGAGAAGVGAALTLAQAGADFLLIEARDRAGGRAWTANHGGYPLDLGCGWLHSSDVNPFVPLARTHGLTVDETRPPWQQIMVEDAFAAQDQKNFRAAQGRFYSVLEKAAREPADRPAADFLDRDAPWSALIDAVSTYVNGVELDRLSVKDFDNYEDSEINFRVAEGYGALIQHLASAAKPAYNCPVQGIDHAGKHIEIETARGTIRARAIIVTASTNILAHEKIRITPALPDKLHAAANLPLGLADKLFLSVERAEDLPDNGRIFGNIDRTATGAYHLRPFGRPMIEGYFGGACARELEKGGLAAFADFAITEICGMLGNHWRARLKPLAASAWERDPFALGSYSHALPGHWDKRAILAAPHGDRLFFAGEATSPHFFSTAHGAYESGVRAAREALLAQRA